MVRIIFVILIHSLGDFFFQGGKLSKLKASNLYYLLEHVGIYTVLFIVLSPLLLGLSFMEGVYFSLLNGCLHFVVDYFTGKWKRKTKQVSEFNYAMAVLVDHSLHLAMLISTYIYLYPHALKAIAY